MKPRLAILFDYPEEGWPSMDLVAHMLLEQLCARHADRFDARRVCPPFKRHFKFFPPAARSGFFRNADRLLNRHHAYPKYARSIAGDHDLFHLVDHSYGQLVNALPAERTGVFCHDLDTFRCLLDPAAEPRPRWFRKMAGRALSGFQKAAVVFYTTDAVRQQIERHNLIDPSRLVKTPLGAAPEFTLAAAETDSAAMSLLNRFEGEPFLLHVGSTIPRKRIDVLLDAFAGVRPSHPDLGLLQIGGEWTAEQREQMQRLGIASAVSHARGLRRTTLAELYRRAAAVLVTSDAEGFGLPVIEALACGAAVAASDLPVLREVGGDAVQYVPVADVPRWVETVGKLIGAHADTSREQRLAQAEKFSWEEHGNVIAEAYEALLSPKPEPARQKLLEFSGPLSPVARGEGPDTESSKLEYRSSKEIRSSNFEFDSSFELRDSSFRQPDPSPQPSPLSTGERGPEAFKPGGLS